MTVHTAVPTTHPPSSGALAAVAAALAPPELAEACPTEASHEPVRPDPLVELIAAHQAAVAEETRLGRLHDEAERLTLSLPRGGAPFPKLLTVVVPGVTVHHDGKEPVRIEPTVFTYTSRAEVEKSGQPPEDKARMIAALERHSAACALEEAENGRTAAAAAEAQAEAEWFGAQDAAEAAFFAIRDYEPASLRELAKQSGYMLEVAGDHLLGEDARPLLRQVFRLAEPGPLRHVPWSDAVADVAAAQVQCAALPADATDEQDRQAGDAHAAAEMRLERLPAPTLAALVQKLAIRIRFEQRTPETLDDTITRLLLDPDYLAWTQGVAITDAITLARLAGEDAPLYPRALNARLKLLGVTVGPKGFDAPEGFRAEALALLNTVTDDEAYTMMAAAWIDAYLAAGGGVAMLDVGGGERVPHFWTDLQPGHDPAQHRLHAMLAVREGGDYRLRRAVVRLITEQLAERGALSCGRSAA